MTLLVFFRTDASLEIGTGHVMRCLTLAQVMREAGATCHFVTRALPGHMGNRIVEEGFDLTLLPAPQGPAPDGPPAHARWAGVDWEQDAAETRAVLGDAPDWLVMDHYAFDARWQRATCPAGTKLMVIDDLADRPHVCDLLLDQNLGRRDDAYDNLIPFGTEVRIGPRFSLLRPEFPAMRAQSLARRKLPRFSRVLVSLGGIDKVGATLQVLDVLDHLPNALDLEISVVVGSNAPCLSAIKIRSKSMRFPCDVRVDVANMAQLMTEADLAIGGAGTASWERCCLGLPTFLVSIAENQRNSAKAQDEAGVATYLGHFNDRETWDALREHLLASTPHSLYTDTDHSATITDGEGTWLIAQRLLANKKTIA